VESGHTSEDFRRNYSKENACTMFNIPIGIPKPTVGLLTLPPPPPPPSPIHQQHYLQ
ncbi:hypothetical protein PIB30_093325, partial [Stylosanthes scabra]|nr:hypothetical protein [Stylosanthes scabra]